MFTKEEKVWLVLNFSPLTGIAELGRKFMAKFRQNIKIRIADKYFRRVVQNFKVNGSTSDGRTSNKRPSLSGDKIGDVRKHFVVSNFFQVHRFILSLK